MVFLSSSSLGNLQVFLARFTVTLPLFLAFYAFLFTGQTREQEVTYRATPVTDVSSVRSLKFLLRFAFAFAPALRRAKLNVDMTQSPHQVNRGKEKVTRRDI